MRQHSAFLLLQVMFRPAERNMTCQGVGVMTPAEVATPAAMITVVVAAVESTTAAVAKISLDKVMPALLYTEPHRRGVQLNVSTMQSLITMS